MIRFWFDPLISFRYQHNPQDFSINLVKLRLSFLQAFEVLF
ncbi:hypothetical protein [Acinetobacter phage Ab69]|nr:hypothetical protein [Acinetobacter phage Ab69]